MTTLKNLKGTAIQFLDADPVVYAGTWSSGGSVNTARAYGGSSGTSRDAAMYFGGYTVPTNYANTEQYNGTSWTVRTPAKSEVVNGITFGNNTFVTWGYSGTLQTSSDNGTSWTWHETNIGAELGAGTFGNGVFVLKSRDYGYTLRSTDNGTSWSVDRDYQLSCGSSVTVLTYSE